MSNAGTVAHRGTGRAPAREARARSHCSVAAGTEARLPVRFTVTEADGQNYELATRNSAATLSLGRGQLTGEVGRPSYRTQWYKELFWAASVNGQTVRD